MQCRFFLAGFIAAFSLLSAAAPGRGEAWEPGADARGSAKPSSEELRPPFAEVLAATNRERADQGLPPLRPHPALMAAAQAHADDMARYGYFRHTDREGREPARRARAQGFPTNTVGENIALGPRNGREVVALWRESPGHRANLLRRDYDTVGVGLAASPAGWLWVQVFGQAARPASLALPDAGPAEPSALPTTVRLIEVDASRLTDRGGAVWVHAEIGGDGEQEVGLTFELPDGTPVERPLRRLNLSSLPELWSFDVPLDAAMAGTPMRRTRLAVYVRNALGTTLSEPVTLEPSR